MARYLAGIERSDVATADAYMIASVVLSAGALIPDIHRQEPWNDSTNISVLAARFACRLADRPVSATSGTADMRA
ncbi:MAG: hypothetical protein NTAFB05_28900 [Nitrobacter sp.]